MAVVTDVFALTLARTVFTKPPDVVRQYSPWPRAIANFTLENGAVSAKPLNDQAQIQVGLTLDPKFAYRLFDFNLNLIQDTAFDWSANTFIEVVDGIKNLPAGNVQRYRALLIDTTDSIATGEMWLINPGTYPHHVIQFSGETVFFNWFANNLTAAASAAGSLNVVFRFWEYEIEQAEYMALHYATLTYPSTSGG